MWLTLPNRFYLKEYKISWAFWRKSSRCEIVVIRTLLFWCWSLKWNDFCGRKSPRKPRSAFCEIRLIDAMYGDTMFVSCFPIFCCLSWWRTERASSVWNWKCEQEKKTPNWKGSANYSWWLWADFSLILHFTTPPLKKKNPRREWPPRKYWCSVHLDNFFERVFHCCYFLELTIKPRPGLLSLVYSELIRNIHILMTDYYYNHLLL